MLLSQPPDCQFYQPSTSSVISIKLKYERFLHWNKRKLQEKTLISFKPYLNLIFHMEIMTLKNALFSLRKKEALRLGVNEKNNRENDGGSSVRIFEDISDSWSFSELQIACVFLCRVWGYYELKSWVVKRLSTVVWAPMNLKTYQGRLGEIFMMNEKVCESFTNTRQMNFVILLILPQSIYSIFIVVLQHKCELSHELHIVLLLFLRKNQQSEWSE